MATIASLKVNILGDSTGLTNSLKNATDKMQAFGERMTDLGGRITQSVTLPLVGIGVAASKMSMDFETSMTQIETLVGLAREQVNLMREDVIALAGQTAKSPKELADALFVVTSAGVRGAEAMQILEQSAKASAIGLGQTQDIARALTAVMQAYAGTGLTAAQATDQLLATVREGNLEAASLAPSLGRVIGIAANMGVTFGEVGANVATFTRLGVSAEQAITGLSGVLRAAMRPSEQAKQELQSMGLSASYLRDSIEKDGLAQALVNLNALFDGNAEGLGRVIPEIEALSNVLGVAGAQSESYIKIQESVMKANGMLDDGFKRVSETAGFRFNKALSDLSSAGIALGDTLAPVFENIASVVSGLADAYNRLSEQAKTVLTTMLSVGAVVGPLIYTLGTLTNVVKGLNIVVLANPYIALATAVLAIGTAAYFALGGLDDMNKQIRESIGLKDQLTGSEDEYNKLLKKQEELNTRRLAIEQMIAAGVTPQQGVFLGQELGRIDQQMKAVRALAREWEGAKGIVSTATTDIANSVEALPTTLPGIEFQEGSIGAMVEELKNLQAQFDATSDSAQRMKFGAQINALETDIKNMGIIARANIVPITEPIERATIATQKLSTSVQGLNRGFIPLATAPVTLKEITAGMVIADQFARQFTDSFGAGMANVVVQGGKLVDILKNIGKLMLSSAIQTAITLMLRGTSAFGIANGTTGLIGKLFGASVSGADVGTMTPASASLTLDGQFQIRGTDLVYVMNRAERSLR